LGVVVVVVVVVVVSVLDTIKRQIELLSSYQREFA